AATTVILPVLAWLASRLVSGPALQGGVMAAGVAPVEVASVALTGLAGGEVVVAAGLLIASTLLTVLLAGPILGLLGTHAATSQPPHWGSTGSWCSSSAPSPSTWPNGADVRTMGWSRRSR